MKGFTTVPTPGGAHQDHPDPRGQGNEHRDGAQRRDPPDSDRFVTRLIPLRYIDAEAIVEHAEAARLEGRGDGRLPADQHRDPHGSASNIRRILDPILESIDVETYKEELAVIKVSHADAATLADQLSQIFGAEVARRRRRRASRARARAGRAQSAGQTASGAARRQPRVRIITDERTNSLLVLAPRAAARGDPRVVAKLDVPVAGGGRIHVYYLKHADAEELAADAERA